MAHFGRSSVKLEVRDTVRVHCDSTLRDRASTPACQIREWYHLTEKLFLFFELISFFVKVCLLKDMVFATM